MRLRQANKSAGLKALARLRMGAGWVTFSKASSGGAPARWVGESAVNSSGWPLQFEQLAVEGVVFGVADHGRVQDVVAVEVVVDLLAPCSVITT
jgi:hypothetical protein